MATKTLTFELFGKDRSASKAIHGVHGELGRGGEQFKRWGRGAALAAAGVAAAFVKFAVDGVQSLARIETINAQTTAAIKSTGGAANVTAEHVEGLSGSLEKLTATEGESIQEGANMLLTFTNIRNEVGEGNDIFDDATAALVDMARAMGTEPRDAAIQLGKALNDPIGGLSALTRVGIQFTDDQKDLIKSLWETGDAAGAQRIILDELGRQFGGSGAAYADTYAGKIDLITHRFGEVQEKAVTALMPALEDLVGFVESDLLPGFENFIGWLTEDAIPALQTFADWVVKSQDDMTTAAQDKEVEQAFVGFWEGLAQALGNGWDQLMAKFANGWDQWVEKFANGADQWVEKFANGWAQINAWNEQGWADFGAKLANGRQQINDGITLMWDGILSSFANGWEQISTWWSNGWTDLGAKLENGRQQINAGIARTVGDMLSKFANGWEQIKGVFSGAAQSISGIANGVARTFASVARTIRDAFRGIGQFIADAFGPIGDFLGGTGNAIRNFFAGTGDAARNIKGRLQAAAYRAPSGGAALARVRATLPSGLSITDTLSSPARDATFGIQRSANSYHYDASNPAVDIAGPIPLLHQYARQLMAMGGWRQFLWQTAGHYDHIHVAHGGGLVSSSWPRMPGDRADERTARLQVGETVVPRGERPTEIVVKLDASALEGLTVPVYLDSKEIAKGIRRHERGLR